MDQAGRLTIVQLHVLLSLAAADRHGYAVKLEIERRTDGHLNLGSGTLYATIQRLLGCGWIVEVDGPPPSDGRPRRFYRLSDAGRQVLKRELAALGRLVRDARRLRMLGSSEPG